MALCLSVCLSVTSQYCIETAELIELAQRLPAAYKGHEVMSLGISNNKGSSLWNFVPNSGLGRISTGLPTDASAVSLVLWVTIANLSQRLSIFCVQHNGYDAACHMDPSAGTCLFQGH